jgi:hypothetical protein
MAHEDEVLDRQKTLAHPAQVGPELLAHDQREGAGVVEHVGVLVRVQADIHRDDRHPGPDRGQDRLDPFRAIRDQHADAIARPGAEPQESPRQAVDPARGLTKRHDPVPRHPGRVCRISLC